MHLKELLSLCFGAHNICSSVTSTIKSCKGAEFLYVIEVESESESEVMSNSLRPRGL